MNEAISSFEIKKEHLMFLGFFVFLWFLGDTWQIYSLFIPFFALNVDGDACGGCGSSDAAGDSASCNEGCPNTDSHSCGTSTPFLRTWNGKEFIFENDVLFGHPASLFPTAREGVKSYEAKSIVSDVYRLQNKSVLQNGVLKFQIKEIEPEESYIDYLALLRVRYPKTAELIVGSKFEDMRVFEKNALMNHEGIKSQQIFLNNTDISSFMGGKQVWKEVEVSDGYFVDTGDEIYVKAQVEDKDKDIHLIMRSYYRDWTAGELYSTSRLVPGLSFHEIFGSSFSFKRVAKGTVLMISIVLFALVSSVNSLLRFASKEDTKDGVYTLTRAFELPRAYADTPPPPKSLVVEYKQEDTFKRIDVVSPRYYQPSLIAVSIPKDAIDESGNVLIRITPTKRHKVYATTLVAPRKKLAHRVERAEASKVFHQRENRDYSAVVNKKYSGEYLHTIPGDTVDVSFAVSELSLSSHEQESYVLEAGGVYTPASEETQKMAGDWISNLDSQSRNVLEHLYSLDTKRAKNKKIVVS